MIRLVSCLLFGVVCASLAAGPVRAELPVAPPPREVRPDGTRDPAPQPEPAPKGEDPAVTVDRIIKNSKEVGDKLAKTDTGSDTLKTQGKILSDIDSLINRQENPPPKPDDKDKEKDKNKEQKPDPMMKDPMMDPNMMPMKDPMNKDGMGNMDPPMTGMNDPPPMGTRRPRLGDPMKDKPEPSDPPKNPNKQPNNTKQPKDPGMTGGVPNGKTQIRPTLPFDENVEKEVWGHLPYKLRQQMSQFYKEDFMPRYAELLRLYYSSLSEKGSQPVMPK
ncbi:MAG: hypothetical protein L0241_27540 [Planctomycetia bacterium]|nr:hypothetical protein [Planctomycetia bacterium]